MIEHNIATNGTVLHVDEYSQTGEPIVFLHMWLGNGGVWSGVVPFFTEQYRVLTVDLRGHGQSEQPATGYEMENLAEDLLGLLDALQIEKVHLVGSSLGCFVSTVFAAKYPERMLTLTHLDGALENWSGPNGAFAEHSKEQLLQHISLQTEPDFADEEEFYQWMKSRAENWNDIHEQSFHAGYVKSLVRLENGRLARKTTISTSLQLNASMYDIRLEPFYAAISCPVLFLPAALHPRFAKKEAFLQTFRSRLRGKSKTVVIPGTKHIMVFDHCQEVRREILQFHAECKQKDV